MNILLLVLLLLVCTLEAVVPTEANQGDEEGVVQKMVDPQIQGCCSPHIYFYLKSDDKCKHCSKKPLEKPFPASLPTVVIPTNKNRLTLTQMSALIVSSTALLALIVSYDRSQHLVILPIMSLGITYSLGMSSAVGYLTQQTAELEAAFSSVERVMEYTDSLIQEKEVSYGKRRGSSTMRKMASISVLFPNPVRPTTPTLCPEFRWNVTSFSTSGSPSRYRRLMRSMNRSPVVGQLGCGAGNSSGRTTRTLRS